MKEFYLLLLLCYCCISKSNAYQNYLQHTHRSVILVIFWCSRNYYSVTYIPMKNKLVIFRLHFSLAHFPRKSLMSTEKSIENEASKWWVCSWKKWDKWEGCVTVPRREAKKDTHCWPGFTFGLLYPRRLWRNRFFFR